MTGFRARRHFTAALAAAAFLSFALAAHAAWIPVKAQLAQWLIERSWETGLAGGTAPAPWPWADTRPAALLEAPAHGVRLFVLEGNSGRNLAFGPVFSDGTAQGRDMVIARSGYSKQGGFEIYVEGSDAGMPDRPEDQSLDTYIEDIEKQMLEDALKRAKYNKTRAAEMLGISFRSFRYKLKKFGID